MGCEGQLSGWGQAGMASRVVSHTSCGPWAQPQRLGPDLDFPLRSGAHPRLWAYRGAPGDFSLPGGPRKLWKGFRGFSFALCSVLPSVLTCVGGRSCDGERKSVFFVHLMKLTSPISGAPFGLDLPKQLDLMVTTQTFIFLNFPESITHVLLSFLPEA